ncbi:hypothetical protein K1T71_015261 [Dendrolimus kikuchii]|nr:hypothetical protein K1T71_015261 [Dendrolimus kikuchii]
MDEYSTPTKSQGSDSQPDLSVFDDDISSNITYRKGKQYDQHFLQVMQDFQKQISESIKLTLDKQSEFLKSTLDSLHDDLGIVRKDLCDMKVNFQNLSLEQISQRKDISNLKCSVETNNHKVESMSKEVIELKSTVNTLSKELCIKDQQARFNNIEICGIPVLKGENLNNILHNISRKIGFPLVPTDIDYIHRVRRFRHNASSVNGGDSQDSSLFPNIIVRLTQRNRKKDMLAAVRARRGLTTADAGLDGPAKPIFISDHLTPYYKLLHKKARQAVKDNNYKYIWLSECKILVRKNDTSKVILISNDNDLQKVK